MQFTQPGMSEHAVASYFEYICALSGAQRPAYVPVVASGWVLFRFAISMVLNGRSQSEAFQDRWEQRYGLCIIRFEVHNDIVVGRACTFPFLLVGVFSTGEHNHAVTTTRRVLLQDDGRVVLFESCKIPKVRSLTKLVALTC